jgi:3-methylcrotonyl-CoA carboxylase alpha subunit
LQVEHTVTEEVTGLDLVELQLRIAMEGRLPVTQEEVVTRGHAIQLRIYAEDASAGFTPSTGLLSRVAFPEGLRVETGVEAGSVISPYYDAMIAKMIVHAVDREAALERCVLALRQTVISGVETNIPFLLSLLEHPVVRAGTADNRFIDRELESLSVLPAPSREEVGLAAALLWAGKNDVPGLGLWSPGGKLACWAYDDGGAPSGPPAFSLRSADGRVWPVVFGRLQGGTLRLLVDGEPVAVGFVRRDAGKFVVSIEGRVMVAAADMHGEAITLHGPFGRRHLHVEPFLKLDAASLSLDGKVLAPMMGTVLKVLVQVGDTVRKSDVLVIEESMKMEMALAASIDGIVTAVRCREGEVVERSQVLIELEPIQGEGA